MARGRSHSHPNYLLHKISGQARVIINGKTYYLGKYGTDSSREKYHRLIAELWRPSKIPLPAAGEIAKEPEIGELAVHYGKHAKKYYVKNGESTSEWSACQRVLRELRQCYATLEVSAFGPKRFKAFRQRFVDQGLARTTINHYMFHVLKMFQLGGEDEIISMDHYRNLNAVKKLAAGRSDARETDDIMPVEMKIVALTLRELTPTVAAMVRLQWLTGMRPGEVRMLRPCDIACDAGVWTYSPPVHKNQHKASRKAKERIVRLGRKAQRILKPFLNCDEKCFCFKPEKRSSNPKPFFDKDSYRKAINRACKRAFPVPKHENEALWRRKYFWNPNQLRHSKLTFARKVAGLETAQQLFKA